MSLSNFHTCRQAAVTQQAAKLRATVDLVRLTRGQHRLVIDLAKHATFVIKALKRHRGGGR